MQLSEDRIASIVDRVVARLEKVEPQRPVPARVNPPLGCGPAPRVSPGRGGVFADIDSAVLAARAAFERYSIQGLAMRYKVIAAMRAAAHRQVTKMAHDAVAETGLGRVDQKELKNRLVIDKTPGPEILDTWAQTGDDGLTLQEYAPFGVIGAITPTTNPTETILCNAIGMLAAGNAVVFNAHPGAKQVSAFTVRFLNEAIVQAGGPENLITATAEPTIELAQALMRHPGIRLLVVTGGPGVVREAMNAGKKVIAAGPGNPPVVVDETADLAQAAQGIVKGVSLDNNIVCTAEKEILAVDAIAGQLKDLMKRCGAYELTKTEIARMEQVVVKDGQVNRKWVGKDATLLLGEIGVQAPPGTLMAFGEVPEEHPFVQLELLTPVVGLVRYSDVTRAIDGAVRCEHGNGHTAAMYSRNIDNLHRMARTINTSIFTKNAPTYAGLGFGGEGYTSFTIASPTGEGLTTARHFSRLRRCTLKDHFRIV
jgi:acyl-CoA reductase-like NAD-dependent aldehyde dehydrogenase